MNKIINSLLLSLLLWTQIHSTEAASPLLPKLRNRTFTEGQVIKNPMKSDCMPVCLVKNTMFWLGLYEGPARATTERAPKFLSDFEFLSEKRMDNRLGKTATFFDEELDTRIYHSVTARPLPDGTVPIVDPESKGLYIYIHGSGTTKAGGANFSYKCTELSRLGYSCLSFDLPFHADGSQSRSLATTEKFMKMVDDLIKKYKVPGKPVYLSGHSFGPEIVFEYVRRYPKGVDGVVAISPAAFNKDLNNWFLKSTSQATDFWGDSRPNDLGGLWGGHVTTDSQWNKLPSKFADPTDVNKDLKVRVLTGDWEEYAPGPVMANGEPAKASRTYDICAELKKFMKNIDCVLEAEVGHYIFAHKDEFGNDVVLREMLRVDQPAEAAKNFPQNMKEEMKKMKAEVEARKLTETERLAQRYHREPFFKSWMEEKGGGLPEIQKMLSSGDQKQALELQREFNLVLQQREKAVLANIQTMATKDPVFYNANKEIIDSIEQSGASAGAMDQLMPKYFDYLSKMDPKVREEKFVASAQVFDVPKAAPKAAKETKVEPGAVASAASAQIKIALPDGSSFAFAMDTPPTNEQVSQIFENIKLLRDAKLHKEAQPLTDWAKQWITYKVNKDKMVESWAYNAEAEALLKARMPADLSRPTAEEVESTLSEIEKLRGEKKFREAEAMKAALVQRGVVIEVKKGQVKWQYSAEE